MAETKHLINPIDNVRRDNKDGAYHCPQCDTPFTRRSNLRRHFQIHMRSAVMKCEKCNEEYSTSEELQAHSLNCYGMGWIDPHERGYHLMQKPYKDLVSSPTEMLISPGLLNQQNYFDGGNYASQQELVFPNFDTSDTFHGNYGGSDFKPIMSPLSSQATLVSSSPIMSSSYDGRFSTPSSPLDLVSHRRPSLSSSISSSSTSTSPYTQNMPNHPQGNCQSCYACTSGRKAYPIPWNNNNFVSSGLPTTAFEEPFYSHSQVKNMIDVVSECLMDSMENVLNRPHTIGLEAISPDLPNRQLARSIRDDAFRQTVMSEAIPQVYYRIHANDDKL